MKNIIYALGVCFILLIPAQGNSTIICQFDYENPADNIGGCDINDDGNQFCRLESEGLPCRRPIVQQ